MPKTKQSFEKIEHIMSKQVFSEALQEACKLWRNVHEIMENLSDKDKLSDKLKA